MICEGTMVEGIKIEWRKKTGTERRIHYEFSDEYSTEEDIYKVFKGTGNISIKGNMLIMEGKFGQKESHLKVNGNAYEKEWRTNDCEGTARYVYTPYTVTFPKDDDSKPVQIGGLTTFPVIQLSPASKVRQLIDDWQKAAQKHDPNTAFKI